MRIEVGISGGVRFHRLLRDFEGLCESKEVEVPRLTGFLAIDGEEFLWANLNGELNPSGERSSDSEDEGVFGRSSTLVKIFSSLFEGAWMPGRGLLCMDGS